MPTPNWAKALSQNPPSCNDIGIPWTEAEAKAVLIDRIPADYVRAGALSHEAYEKMKGKNDLYKEKHGEYPLIFWTRDELYHEADRLEIPYTATTPKTILANAIELGRQKEEIRKAEEETKKEEQEKTEEKTEEEVEEEAEEEIDLKELSKEELKNIAEKEDVEISSTDNKGDIIKKIKKARKLHE